MSLDVAPQRKYYFFPTIANLIANFTNEDVIDVGCGSGEVTQMIRNVTKGRVVGIDISEE
jgi:ubiquinone/menaquinone biosynthesis C-methylase UbiE